MAPIQCVTWGHPETTGSPCADYFLSSELLETADADGHYTESLVRMPLLGTFYERPVLSGPTRNRASLGLPEDRHVYLCPQTLFKFHPDFDAILAGIVAADPQAEIVLLEGRVPAWTERLRKRWASTIPQATHRMRFLPAVPRDDFLSLLKLAEVIIDPLHFGGGNSTYEAMGMGTPVITLPGDFLRSRITYAMYQKMGWTDLVVQSPEAYVAAAVACVVDPEVRTRVRQAIVQRADCLFEDPREVRVLEDALVMLANRPA
jgi:predicted O-linked N-acetylglucosamine transferase (SPINDLY family)